MIIKNPRPGSAVIVVHEGKILLGKRNKVNANNKWVLPGGGIDWGETSKDAAKREALEETGLEVELEKLVCIKEIIAIHADYHAIVFFYLAKPKNTDITVSDDLSEAKFFTIDEIKALDCVTSVEEVLKEAKLWS
ncbi:DNA mismatch repair protein MutT [Candidatus Woesearchaeota archaeon CG10_big_fil_rev_8_21_14_0_10_32_9]|nr:MAG: DNA mismatch repair protein MutT [Candidatus Woesearchaeota archaeon CG10_big_fil_rev_8_21_14_0_10_32_9]